MYKNGVVTQMAKLQQIKEKEQVVLTQTQKDVIVGSLLGDGNLQSATQGRSWRYRALQGKNQLTYLQYKYNVLQNLCGTGLLYDERVDDRTSTYNKHYYFNTLVHDCLKHYGNMFYTFDDTSQKFTKDVPQNVRQVLTPRALAILYQDDGALKWENHSNAMRVCTESFSLEGVNRLKNAIESLYGFKVTTQPKYKTLNGIKTIVGYRIIIPERSSEAFVEVIKPYVIDSMKYKVSDGKKGHL